MGPVVFRQQGFCPICETPVTFSARDPWLRDYLVCPKCNSVPRERALAVVLDRHVPDWRNRQIHESSPAPRGISVKLARECRGYVATQYFPDASPGAIVRTFRNENLERQTFADESFDVVVSLDVMEHVNEPKDVLAEVWRTLRPGGSYVFTTPTFKGMTETQRWARYLPNGEIDALVEPVEYHGNPISDKGALVTFHYGYDLPDLIAQWAPFATTVYRFRDQTRGILGEFTEVYVSAKLDQGQASGTTISARRQSLERLMRRAMRKN